MRLTEAQMYDHLVKVFGMEEAVARERTARIMGMSTREAVRGYLEGAGVDADEAKRFAKQCKPKARANSDEEEIGMQRMTRDGYHGGPVKIEKDGPDPKILLRTTARVVDGATTPESTPPASALASHSAPAHAEHHGHHENTDAAHESAQKKRPWWVYLIGALVALLLGFLAYYFIWGSGATTVSRLGNGGNTPATGRNDPSMECAGIALANQNIPGTETEKKVAALIRMFKGGCKH